MFVLSLFVLSLLILISMVKVISVKCGMCAWYSTCQDAISIIIIVYLSINTEHWVNHCAHE